MAALVKANASLTAGELAIIKRDFSTTNTGVMTYSITYVCLEQYATRWTPHFKSEMAPPTPLPQNILSLNLTKTPSLVDLKTNTTNGLCYFDATYSAGVATDVVITESSEQRNLSWILSYNSGNVPVTASFDYISHSVSVSGTNSSIPVVRGRTGNVFNARNISAATVLAGKFPRIQTQTIETTNTTRNRLGEYTNTVTSSGIYTAEDATPSNREPSSAGSVLSSPQVITFGGYDPTSLTGVRGRGIF